MILFDHLFIYWFSDLHFVGIQNVHFLAWILFWVVDIVFILILKKKGIYKQNNIKVWLQLFP